MKEEKNKVMARTMLLSAASLFAMAFCLASCSDDDPEPLVVPEKSVVYETVPNGSFEDDLKDWSVSGDTYTVSVADEGSDGNKSLEVSGDGKYQTTVQQLVTGLDDGYYDLEFNLKSTGGQTACYLAAGSDEDSLKMTSLQQSVNAWCRSIVRGIKVEGGRCNIKLVVNSDVTSSCKIDGLKLIKGRKPFELLKGGDASYVTYLEKIGAGLYDNGVNKDAFKLFKEKGFNTVRFRLYKDPGNPNYEASAQIPEGCQTTEAILALAKRAKAEGLKILLSFHYSDTWTNPGQQIMPHEWEGLSWDSLQTAFYDYTRDVMMKMRDQGTVPEYVAIGNETQSGMLHPVANHEHYDKLARLYTLGYEAVKDVCPESKVIVHVSNGGDSGYYWFFGLMRQYGAKFDLIGISYYPFDTPTKNFKWSDIRTWAENMYKEFGKETVIMETGYNWSPTIPMGIAGQLWDDGVYKDIYPYTPQGQKNYLLEAINEMKRTEDCHILGFYYWDPLLRYVKDDHSLDWGNGACSEAFFDFEGNALPVFEAYTYNN